MISTQTQKLRLFEKPFLVIEYDVENQILIQNWKGFASSPQFREGIEKSIEIFRQRKPMGLISNTKESSVVKKEDTEWAATYGIGNMLENGLKAVAFIIPGSAFTQMSITNFKDKLKEAPFPMQYFDELDKAVAWLKTVK